MYKNKNKNTRDNATQPANATRTVYYEELSGTSIGALERCLWSAVAEAEGLAVVRGAMASAVVEKSM
ncbi:MAG: hypothetical protein O4859_05690 [Trichodesmium sp. St18_bin1]|nr:hypothetical protein [Trichodesmium sp. St18_bin1]